MITIVIGQSGCGKTSYVRKRFLQGGGVPKKGPVPYTLAGNAALIGLYGLGIRTEGTDTLSYTALPQILQLIDELYPSHHIVAEGDRINTPKFFEHIIGNRYKGKLILLHCDVGTSIRRLQKSGSKISEAWVKSTKTKSANNFKKYGTFLQGESICVE